jgi:hypothetical protein
MKKNKYCENFKIMRNLLLYYFYFIYFNHILKFENFRV